jgi:hypothetical protein
LQGRFGGEALRDQPDTGAEDAKDKQYCGAKNRDLLLAQAHCRIG